MMLFVWLTLGLLVVLAAAVCYYPYSRERPVQETLSAVTRQHIDLDNGGQLDEAATLTSTPPNHELHSTGASITAPSGKLCRAARKELGRAPAIQPYPMETKRNDARKLGTPIRVRLDQPECAATGCTGSDDYGMQKPDYDAIYDLILYSFGHDLRETAAHFPMFDVGQVSRVFDLSAATRRALVSKLTDMRLSHLLRSGDGSGGRIVRSFISEPSPWQENAIRCLEDSGIGDATDCDTEPSAAYGCSSPGYAAAPLG